MADGSVGPTDSFSRLASDIEKCRVCPRLVSWRETVATQKRAAFRDQEYWGRGVPGFGDPQAKVVVVGLAPAAHGANRTGRMFTGDRSGDWLYASLWRTGFANQPSSISRDDALELNGMWITAPVKCAPPANKPTPQERDNCAPFMLRELALLHHAKVFVALGAFGYGVLTKMLGLRPRPKFRHGLEVDLLDGRHVLASYHVSQQNTFTGRLTEEMTDAVFHRAQELAG